MPQVIEQSQSLERPPVPIEDPGQRLLSYYDAAIRLVGKAKAQTIKGDAAAQDETLGEVYILIAELNNALDFQRSPELCQNLEQIYEFMGRQLVAANATMDIEPLEVVEMHLSMLKDAWSQVIPPTPIEA